MANKSSTGRLKRWANDIRRKCRKCASNREPWYVAAVLELIAERDILQRLNDEYAKRSTKGLTDDNDMRKVPQAM